MIELLHRLQDECQTFKVPNESLYEKKREVTSVFGSNHYEFFYLLMKALKPSVAVEIGTHYGLSALRIREV